MAQVQNSIKRSQNVVVIGAGIGGLSAALRLASLGNDVRVIEAASKPGGKIRTRSGANAPRSVALIYRFGLLNVHYCLIFERVKNG